MVLRLRQATNVCTAFSILTMPITAVLSERLFAIRSDGGFLSEVNQQMRSEFMMIPPDTQSIIKLSGLRVSAKWKTEKDRLTVREQRGSK